MAEKSRDFVSASVDVDAKLKEAPVLFKADGDHISIICNTDYQLNKVLEQLHNDDCYMTEVDKWEDEGDGNTWLVVFNIANKKNGTFSLEMN